MKLTSISVTNFRSITKAHKIELYQKTVLLGRNNEGKSNILLALQLAMKLLHNHADSESDGYRDARRIGQGPQFYDWRRDFPINLQTRKSGTQTIIKLTFSLDEFEVSQFKSEIGSNLNGELPIRVTIGKTNLPSIKVIKQGTGSVQLNKSSNKIAAFIANKISFNYIPAVRTDFEASNIVSVMVSEKLRSLENDQEYKDALATIKTLQEPLLKELSKKIEQPLKEFLPNISEVRIEMPDGARRQALRRTVEIYVDDGNLTNLSLKGDGVKSLATLGLLRDRAPDIGASIVAIEEPESHLHPGAIHQLYKVLESISEQNQIILTTHNPLFVDRNRIKCNVIVDNGKARSAHRIDTIRDLLGIKASDNLTNARHVLVVEGKEDAVVMRALLRDICPGLKERLDDSYLAIEELAGAGNLTYRLSHLKSSLCNYHCLLDDDEAGRTAFEKAYSEGLITEKQVTFTTCQGSPNSELEDCFSLDSYSDEVFEKFGVDLKHSTFRSNKKWSERTKLCFKARGKPWNDAVESRVKYVVAESIAKAPSNALNEHKRVSIDALISSLYELTNE